MKLLNTVAAHCVIYIHCVVITLPLTLGAHSPASHSVCYALRFVYRVFNAILALPAAPRMLRPGCCARIALQSNTQLPRGTNLDCKSAAINHNVRFGHYISNHARQGYTRFSLRKASRTQGRKGTGAQGGKPQQALQSDIYIARVRLRCALAFHSFVACSARIAHLHGTLHYAQCLDYSIYAAWHQARWWVTGLTRCTLEPPASPRYRGGIATNM